MQTSYNDQTELDNNQQEENNNTEKTAVDLCQVELKQTKDNLLRLNADFDNYKKRVVKEKISWISDAQAEVIKDLLPIIDDFERATTEYKKKEFTKEFEVWISGFELINKAFQKFLEKHNIREIKDIFAFNPEYHEAIAQIDSENVASGEIIEVVQRGFTLNDKVLRPAKVVVAK